MKSNIKHWTAALACSAIVCGTHAQSKFRAYALAQGGLTVPAQTPSFFGEIAGGVRYGRFGLGLATGADEAPVKSIPFLVDTQATQLFKIIKTALIGMGAGPETPGSWERTDWAGILTIGWRL